MRTAIGDQKTKRGKPRGIEVQSGLHRGYEIASSEQVGHDREQRLGGVLDRVHPALGLGKALQWGQPPKFNRIWVASSGQRLGAPIQDVEVFAIGIVHLLQLTQKGLVLSQLL